jgi:hypothetical protein
MLARPICVVFFKFDMPIGSIQCEVWVLTAGPPEVVSSESSVIPRRHDLPHSFSDDKIKSVGTDHSYALVNSKKLHSTSCHRSIKSLVSPLAFTDAIGTT